NGAAGGAGAADRIIADERTPADGHGARIVNAAALFVDGNDKRERAIAIARDRVGRQVHGGPRVIDPASLGGGAAAATQVGQRDRPGTAGDVKDPAGVVGRDVQHGGFRPARTLDGQALVDEQLAAVQIDDLAGEALIEDDGVAALGGGDLGPQRTGSAV